MNPFPLVRKERAKGNNGANGEGHGHTIPSRGDINECNEEDGCTPLHLAASSGDVGYMRALLDANADIDITCDEGVTPLHAAVAGGHLDAVELLIARGADLELTDVNLGTPIVLVAMQEGHDDVARILLDLQIGDGTLSPRSRRRARNGKGRNKMGSDSPVSEKKREKAELIKRRSAKKGRNNHKNSEKTPHPQSTKAPYTIPLKSKGGRGDMGEMCKEEKQEQKSQDRSLFGWLWSCGGAKPQDT